mmetsp:Transcript_16086/g.46080  ORF Transcript_16086/g.46080 Transcript_16086/m.46080 type:complete len:223 (-) Transcript_16086:370-1038(-)
MKDGKLLLLHPQVGRCRRTQRSETARKICNRRRWGGPAARQRSRQTLPGFPFASVICHINSPNYVNLEVAALNNIDLSTIDMVLTPIYEPSHWTLGVINYKHQRFDYYNSLGNPIPATSRAGMRKLAQWIAGRATGSAGDPTTGPPDGDKWKFHRMACPQQQNWIDCGVFVCQYANYLSTGRPLWQSEDGSIEGGRLDMLLAFSNEQDWRARSIPPAGAAGG